MDYSTIIESFFTMLGRFDFDRAKNYIDGRKDVLQRLAPTFPNQAQLMAMLTTFSHLAEVEKNYHNQPYLNQQTHHHSFLPTASFLRKPKSLKDMYNDIYIELQQLEQMETPPSRGFRDCDYKSATNMTSSSDGKPIQTAVATSKTSPKASLPALPRLQSKQSIDSQNGDHHSSNSSSTDKDSPVTHVPQSPGAALKNSFFRVLSPISSSSTSSPSAKNTALQPHNEYHTSTPSVAGDPYSVSSGSGYEPPPNSTTTTPIVAHTRNLREFSDKLISHICCQLLNFIQARLDLIDVYDKLIEASNKKFLSVDGIAFRLSMLCRQYHKFFHHPLLEPIKDGITLECESLMTLIKATIDMQHWRYLPTLYDLQDAQSKLNYWATNTFNKEATRRRFKVSKTQTAPRLYEWLCKFKDFLVAKFTLYFHATLSKHFPTNSFKSVCSKLTVDYYSRLSSVQRKVDALFVALMYDVSNEKDFRGVGYHFPSKDYQQPQGKNTLQPMVVIPNEAKPRLHGLQAEIYMIVMTNQQTMLKDGHYQFHDNIKKLTYSIARPDMNVVLVTVCDGQKLDRDTSVRMFSQEFTNQFAFSNVFIA